MSTKTFGDLIAVVGKKLKLEWLQDPPRGTGRRLQEAPSETNPQNPAMVGALNCIHPNRIQIVGQAEWSYLHELGANAYGDTIHKLFSDHPLAIIFCDGLKPTPDFTEQARVHDTGLLGSEMSDHQVIGNLQYFLVSTLASRVTVHGAFLEVSGLGVLLTGSSAVGKSELALALISRGHRLVADDAPEFAQVAPDTLSGSCPLMLRDFLEVRGLGILNVRAMFGDNAVRQKKNLHLIINLQKMSYEDMLTLDRLNGSFSTHELLGIPIPLITLPVAPGRNLAALVEAAVLQHTLRLRGYDATQDLMDRQRLAIEEGL